VQFFLGHPVATLYSFFQGEGAHCIEVTEDRLILLVAERQRIYARSVTFAVHCGVIGV